LVRNVESGCGAVQSADDAFDDIVDVGEVALHVAVVEDVDRPAFEDRLGEQEQRHVGPAPRAVDGEEEQARARDAEQVTVGVREEFVRLFAGRVQTHRVSESAVFATGIREVALPKAATARRNQALRTRAV
jgi:hypothetical protein